MRHKVHKYGLGVTRGHRKAMMANMAASLITHERIQTTLTKARALRPFIEKIITKAKKAGLAKDKKDAIHLRRLALADVRDENAITKLFNETWKQFENRNGGYTRIYKLGRRDSDAAEVAIIEFVKADDPGYKKSRSRAKKTGKKSAAPTVETPAEATTEKAAGPAAEAPAATPAEAPAEAAVPAAETPTAEAPVAEAAAPAAEAPVAEAPAAAAPVAEAPVDEKPAAEGESKV